MNATCTQFAPAFQALLSATGPSSEKEVFFCFAVAVHSFGVLVKEEPSVLLGLSLYRFLKDIIYQSNEDSDGILSATLRGLQEHLFDSSTQKSASLHY